MKFDKKEILKELDEKGFEEIWEKYSKMIPKSSEYEIKSFSGRSHPVNDAINALRQGFIELGFREVINPIIIDESEVYKQYGPGAPVILDRVYYLAGLPRPDIGLDEDTIAQIKKEIGDIDIAKLKEILRLYREGSIEADDLFETMKKELSITEEKIIKLMKIFDNFFKLRPEPSSLTLRSHMTGAWFKTLAEVLEFEDPPIYLFSIDKVFRREQQEDQSHLRTYHSASVVVVDEDLSEDYAFELTKRIVSMVEKKLGLTFKDFKIVKKLDTSTYYAKDKEWEVYVKLGDKDYEIGTFGFYNPISLARYDIDYPVYNYGMGLERIVQVARGVEDIRALVYDYRYFTFSDEEIKQRLRPLEEPKTDYYKNLVKVLKSKVLEYKDKPGPFEELVYEDDKLRIYFIEPDQGKKFLGPAGLNKIYIDQGNIISSTKGLKGLYVSDYLELILKRILSMVEKGHYGLYRVKWVEGPSDVNLYIDDKLLKWLTKNNRKIDIKGPIFLDIRIEKK